VDGTKLEGKWKEQRPITHEVRGLNIGLKTIFASTSENDVFFHPRDAQIFTFNNTLFALF
jgi:hypothetical protein